MKNKLFKYKAISERGTKINGSVFSTSKDIAIEAIEAKGYVLLKIVRDHSIFVNKTLSLSDNIKFIEEFFAYISYGLSVGEALKYVAEDERLNSRLRYSSSLAESMLLKGNDISVSLLKAGVRKELASTISASISTGRLEETMPEILKQYKTIKKIRGQWISLSIYPAIMLLFLSVTMVVMIEYLSPLQKKVLINIADNDYESIPERSKIIFSLVENFSHYLITYVPVIVFLIVSSHIIMKLKSSIYGVISRMIWYKMPFSGSLMYKLEISSILKMISISLSCGLSEAEAVKIVYDQTDDKYILKKLSVLMDTINNMNMTIGDGFEQARLLKGIHVAILRSEKGGRDSLIKCLSNISKNIETVVVDDLKSFANFSGVIGDLMIYIFATPVILAIVIPQFDGVLMAISKF